MSTFLINVYYLVSPYALIQCHHSGELTQVRFILWTFGFFDFQVVWSEATAVVPQVFFGPWKENRGGIWGGVDLNVCKQRLFLRGQQV